MTPVRFNVILKDRQTKISRILASKQKEYAVGGDRLHNFKRAGILDAESPEKALWGMLKKHIISVRDMIEALERSRECPDYALWDEKLGDFINYLILLEALIIERIEQNLDSHLSNLEAKDVRS